MNVCQINEIYSLVVAIYIKLYIYYKDILYYKNIVSCIILRVKRRKWLQPLCQNSCMINIARINTIYNLIFFKFVYNSFRRTMTRCDGASQNPQPTNNFELWHYTPQSCQTLCLYMSSVLHFSSFLLLFLQTSFRYNSVQQ